MAFSAKNPDLGDLWRSARRILAARTHPLIEGRYQSRAIQEIDVEGSLALLIGPMMYWFLFLSRSSENKQPSAEHVVNTFWRAYALTRPRR